MTRRHLSRAHASPARASPARALGFTLVEVLVALTIVAICLAAGLRAAGTMTDNADRLQVSTLAQWCAENQFTDLRLTNTFPGVGDSSFNCTQLSREFTGTLMVRPTPNPNFRRVEAQIFDAQRRPLLSLTTIVGRDL